MYKSMIVVVSVILSDAAWVLWEADTQQLACKMFIREDSCNQSL